MPRNVYHQLGRTILPLLFLTLVSNLGILISPLFMMQVLDRVIPSGNTATLTLIGLLAVAALSVQAVVETCRDLTLGRLARWTEQSGTVMAIDPHTTDQNKVIGHVAGYSSFLSGQAVIAALGAPWIPIFLFALWLLHPAFTILLLFITGLNLSVRIAAKASSHTALTNALACSQQETVTLRAATDLEATKGPSILAQNLRRRFAGIQQARHNHIDQCEGSSISQSAASNLFRNICQIAALGIGAFLVTKGIISAGGMIAGSILTAKSYGSVEALLIQIPAIRSARDDYRALTALQIKPANPSVALDTLKGQLKAENLIVPRGGGAPPRLDRVSFALAPGECLAIVGSSGSGKSTLLRALCGISPAAIGSVFLDENEIRGLNDQSLYQITGFLPQQVTFKTGTIAENLSCFEPNPDPTAIVEAAKLAGVYGLISALPESFETNLGVSPFSLSAGQTQRVALARAIYNRPRFLFLDEPNALLDAEGERALGQTLLRLKKQGMTIVMVMHRSGVLGLADKVLHLENGRTTDFGPKSEVLSRLGMGGRQIDLPCLETSLSDLKDWIASQFTRAGDQGFRYKTQILADELLKLACTNCPPDTLQFSKFTFRFLGDTRCEITMNTPEVEEAAKTMRAVQKPNNTSGKLVHLTQEEVRLAKLVHLSEKLEVATLEDFTVYTATLIAENIEPELSVEQRIQ